MISAQRRPRAGRLHVRAKSGARERGAAWYRKAAENGLAIAQYEDAGALELADHRKWDHLENLRKHSDGIAARRCKIGRRRRRASGTSYLGLFEALPGGSATTDKPIEWTEKAAKAGTFARKTVVRHLQFGARRLVPITVGDVSLGLLTRRAWRWRSVLCSEIRDHPIYVKPSRTTSSAKIIAIFRVFPSTKTRRSRGIVAPQSAATPSRNIGSASCSWTGWAFRSIRASHCRGSERRRPLATHSLQRAARRVLFGQRAPPGRKEGGRLVGKSGAPGRSARPVRTRLHSPRPRERPRERFSWFLKAAKDKAIPPPHFRSRNITFRSRAKDRRRSSRRTASRTG